MCNWSIDQITPKYLGKAGITYDETMVRRCVELIAEWDNPFQINQELTRLT